MANASDWEFYERHFAPARLQHYLTHTAGDQAAAMELYRGNVAISGAFWQSLAYFEVALRNALDERMSVRRRAGVLVTEPGAAQNPAPGGTGTRIQGQAWTSSPCVVREPPRSLWRSAGCRGLYRPRSQDVHR